MIYIEKCVFWNILIFDFSVERFKMRESNMEDGVLDHNPNCFVYLKF